MPRRLRQHRKISAADAPKRNPTTVSIEQSHAKQIRELPSEQYRVVIQSLAEGVKSGDIARYFAEEGWLRVKENTFVQYLTAFKRIYSAEIRIGGDEESQRSLGVLVSARQPHLDEEVVLEQLIRVQNTRIKQAIDFERSSGLTMPNLHKDVNLAVTAVETLAKVRGKLAGAGRPSAESLQPVSTEAQEQLRKSAQSEGVQDKMAGMVNRLAGLLTQKASQ